MQRCSEHNRSDSGKDRCIQSMNVSIGDGLGSERIQIGIRIVGTRRSNRFRLWPFSRCAVVEESVSVGFRTTEIATAPSGCGRTLNNRCPLNVRTNGCRALATSAVDLLENGRFSSRHRSMFPWHCPRLGSSKTCKYNIRRQASGRVSLQLLIMRSTLSHAIMRRAMQKRYVLAEQSMRSMRHAKENTWRTVYGCS